MAVQTLNIAVTPEANLTRYLQEIRKFPMLEAGEEVHLARQLRDNDDIEAGHKLVNSHLRLVAKLARGYNDYGPPLSDLICEGNIGMIQAVRRFDPDRGFRLATYAMWWIKAAIQEYILHSWSLVKMGTTAAQKKLFFNLRKLKNELRAIEEGDLLPENVSEIAIRLNVSENEVIMMNRRLAKPDNSLNAPLAEEGEGEWQDWLVGGNESQETVLADAEEFGRRRVLLEAALEGLNNVSGISFGSGGLPSSPPRSKYLATVTVFPVSAFVRSKCARSKNCENPCAMPLSMSASISDAEFSPKRSIP